MAAKLVRTMPRSCTVCKHPERQDIDRALVGERRAAVEADLRRMAGEESRGHR